MPPTSPTVIAWDLGIRMREAREQVGMRGVKAAKRLDVSQNYLSDVEHGKRKLTEETLAAAIPVYGIPQAEQEELWTLREQVDQRGWWSQYSGIFAPEVLRYFGLEHGAESIQMYENLLIPGLLQTEAYAYAVVTGDRPNIRPSDTARRVEARMMRQRRLTDHDPLKLTVLLSEAALKQQVGGRDVLAEQLRHMIDMIEKHPTTLDARIIPLHSGAHGALGASTFNLLTFSSPRLPTIAWQENITSAAVIHSSARVNQYNQTYVETVRQAEDREHSLELIYAALKEIL